MEAAKRNIYFGPHPAKIFIPAIAISAVLVGLAFGLGKLILMTDSFLIVLLMLAAPILYLCVGAGVVGGFGYAFGNFFGRIGKYSRTQDSIRVNKLNITFWVNSSGYLCMDECKKVLLIQGYAYRFDDIRKCEWDAGETPMITLYFKDGSWRNVKPETIDELFRATEKLNALL